MGNQSPTGWIRVPLNAWQIFILERASDLSGKNVEDIIADQVEMACRRFAPKVNAKELLDFAELFVESVEEGFEEDSPVMDLRNKASELIEFMTEKFPDLVEDTAAADSSPKKIETEKDWLDEVINKAKEHKHDPNGPKDIRDK